MATEKVIEITIDGSKTDIEPIKGFKDGSCLSETKALQDALGVTISQNKKPEAAITPKQQEKVTLKK